MQLSSRMLTGLIVSILVILTAQGWTGDFVNLFALFPIGSVGHTLGGFIQAVTNVGRMEITHAIIGTILIVLAIVILFIPFRFVANRGVRIFAIIGFLGILSAAYGGISFVLSGFQNNGSSAQMGGSFIGSYASYFLVLYFNKR